MELLLNGIVAGVSTGAVYGLIGLGYVVIYNATRVFNLAQGNLVMVGVMLSWYVLNVLRWPTIAALPVVIVAVTALAVIEERAIVRWVIRADEHRLDWLIATLGFGLIVETIIYILYGNRPTETIPSLLPIGGFAIGILHVQWKFLLAVLALATTVIALELFQKRTWFGQAMRATAEDREAAGLRGIEPNQISTAAFALGGLVAAIAGYVLAPIVTSDPTLGTGYGLKGFAALAIGGFGSFRGAIVGAMVFGVGEQLFFIYGNAQYGSAAGLLILMAVLLFRPNGIFGGGAARTV